MSRTGQVFLVGAGPGDPELITVRGLRCLERADVVVYDRLIHPALLDACPSGAEKVFVGKAAGLHVVVQEDIEALLVDRARRGLVVVRLKGGDPFVFGRGGEEAMALEAAGIRWTVVPAVSSVVAAPASAGIPVTHRRLAASFAVVTAHRAADLGPSSIDWNALARIDTLVVLMGVAALADVARRLCEAGRDPSTPVAVVERGTLEDQRVTTGTLETIASRAHAVGVRAPATIVVGAVVDLHEVLGATAPAEHPTPVADWRVWTPTRPEVPLPSALSAAQGARRHV